MGIGENGNHDDRKMPGGAFVTIDLFGREFQFKADASHDNPREIVDKLKAYVDRAEKEAQLNPSAQNRFVILLLAGMNMANDLRVAESELSGFQKQLNTKTSDLLQKLNDFARKAVHMRET